MIGGGNNFPRMEKNTSVSPCVGMLVDSTSISAPYSLPLSSVSSSV